MFQSTERDETTGMDGPAAVRELLTAMTGSQRRDLSTRRRRTSETSLERAFDQRQNELLGERRIGLVGLFVANPQIQRC